MTHFDKEIDSSKGIQKFKGVRFMCFVVNVDNFENIKVWVDATENEAKRITNEIRLWGQKSGTIAGNTIDKFSDRTSTLNWIAI